MGWNEYYSQCYPDSFRVSEKLYSRIVEGVLSPKSGILKIDRPFVFILGGLYPFSETPAAFLDFCKRMHKDPLDKHIFLDMNWISVSSLNSLKYPDRIQANLKALPFINESVDFIFLDSTINFMDDQTVRQFSTTVAEVLSPHGLILVSTRIPGILEGFLNRQVNHIPLYVRNTNRLQKLLPDLKMIDWFEGDRYELRVFSRSDTDNNIYPPHEGQPFCLMQ